jgi:hypothetical protein
MVGQDLACVTLAQGSNRSPRERRAGWGHKEHGDTIGCPSQIWQPFTVMGLSEISHWLT